MICFILEVIRTDAVCMLMRGISVVVVIFARASVVMPAVCIGASAVGV